MRLRSTVAPKSYPTAKQAKNELDAIFNASSTVQYTNGNIETV
jgi:hypothetical protein